MPSKRICDWAQADNESPAGYGGIIEYTPRAAEPWTTGRRTGFCGLETITGPAFATFEDALEHMKKLGFTFKQWRAMLPCYVSTKVIKDFDSRCTVE